MPISCDSSDLLNASRCIDTCVPDGAKDAVLIYILATMAGVSTDPADLINASRQIDCCVPKGMRQAIIAQLLCALANRTQG